MKTKRVTIKDIAELGGVFKATASLVLNGRGKELRVAQKRASACWRLPASSTISRAFTPARCAITAATPSAWWCRRSPTTALRSFPHELEMLCREAGVQLLISCTDENPGQESMVVNNMIARQVDGSIVASCMHNDADYLEAQRRAAGGAV